jgi:hypothetical protein
LALRFALTSTLAFRRFLLYLYAQRRSASQAGSQIVHDVLASSPFDARGAVRLEHHAQRIEVTASARGDDAVAGSVLLLGHVGERSVRGEVQRAV